MKGGAVIYTRVSSRDQVDGYSLISQLSACTAYCERQGYSVARVFVEEGESAKTADRTQLKELLAFCRREHGRLHALVVYNLSRFARDRFDHHALLAHLRRMGIVLRSVTEPVDETPTGELMDSVLAAMHQFDNQLRAGRTLTGMQAALREGRWTWRAPLGYLNPEGGGGLLEHDPERAPLVLWAFERLAAGGIAQAELRRQVTERGLRSESGRPLGHQTWHQMLRNPLYGGRVIYDRWGVDVATAFEPIVPRETWLRAQRVLAGGEDTAPAPATRSYDHPDFPLRRFVRCGGCGVGLTGSWARGAGGRYAYYHCRTRGCRGVSRRTHLVEQEFLELLDSLRPSRAYLRLLREEVLACWGERQEAARAQTAALERRLQTLRRRKERLIEVYVYEAGIDQDTYRRQLAKLSEELTLAELALAGARIEDLDVDGLLHYAEHVMTSAARLWREMAPSQRRQFEQRLFPAGLDYDARGGFRTPVTSSIFRTLGGPEAGKSVVVHPSGAPSNVLQWLHDVAELRSILSEAA